MKANELNCNDLMIGDWVLDGNIYAQVTSITCDGIIETTHNEHSNIELVEPIHLTPEILEKNGFEVTRNMSSSGNKDVWSLRVSKNKVFHIIEHHNKKMFPYFWIEIGSNSDIKYVHQLQHALILCGITSEIIL